ncbi:APC family permease [Cellulomonas edaphi]|uniref:APC family permease n=1 Tax=Cellulomonas edaphi TaxID=3053468 RepID=A0ABT7S2R6_9CELL|nr:APC family permease [Cellulomons edaphi]MDM7829918.1 APC family permease [Cellulomons edaphi]
MATLARKLGVADAVVVGLGAMLGAGIFAAFSPAAEAAGSGLLIGLGIAAVVAFCNATSSARLAAVHPESGGTYVYARRRLGTFWGFQAGWSFVVGKTASCAAMALTFASYAAPGQARLVAVLAVVALTALNYRGVQRSARLSRLIVALTLCTLVVVVVAALAGGTASSHNVAPFPGSDLRGILQSAGLLFFAFAGYARIATLGEEVVDPRRTIPRAVPLALGIVLVVYLVVAASALLAVGADGLAATTAPLRAVVEAGSYAHLSPVVQVGAAVASLGALLALILGVSRTTLAMARDRELPPFLGAIHPRHGVPYRAELAVAVVVIGLVAVLDVRGAIGFSSFGVLTYYTLTNASALRMRRDEGRAPHWVAALGLLGCLVLALTLPVGAVVGGAVVALLGAAVWLVRHRRA